MIVWIRKDKSTEILEVFIFMLMLCVFARDLKCCIFLCHSFSLDNYQNKYELADQTIRKCFG